MTHAERWFQTMTREFPGSFSIRRGRETILAETPALVKRLNRELLSFGDADIVIDGKTVITLARHMAGYEWAQGDEFCLYDGLYETANDTPLTDGSWNGEVVIITLKRISKL